MLRSAYRSTVATLRTRSHTCDTLFARTFRIFCDCAAPACSSRKTPATCWSKHCFATVGFGGGMQNACAHGGSGAAAG